MQAHLMGEVVISQAMATSTAMDLVRIVLLYFVLWIRVDAGCMGR